jgi:hypothetical protein
MYCALDQVDVAAESMYALYASVAAIMPLPVVVVEQVLPEVVFPVFPVIVVEVVFPAIDEIVLVLPVVVADQALLAVELAHPVEVEMEMLFVVYARLN